MLLISPSISSISVAICYIIYEVISKRESFLNLNLSNDYFVLIKGSFYTAFFLSSSMFF